MEMIFISALTNGFNLDIRCGCLYERKNCGGEKNERIKTDYEMKRDNDRGSKTEKLIYSNFFI